MSEMGGDTPLPYSGDESGVSPASGNGSERASARISHQDSAAAADTGMSASLRSVGLLDVVSTTSARPSVARLASTPVSTTSRRTLARNAGSVASVCPAGPPVSGAPFRKRPSTERVDAPRPARRPTEAYPRWYGEGGQRSRRGCSGPRMPASEGMVLRRPASTRPRERKRLGASARHETGITRRSATPLLCCAGGRLHSPI